MKKGRRTGTLGKLLTLTQEETVDAAVRAITNPLLAHVHCPPTDLEALGDWLGVARREEDIGGAGQLRKNGNGYEIVYSPAQSNGRQRFTIAHELAHFILIQELKYTPPSTKQVERLCDMIAAEILLPETHLRAAFPDRWTVGSIFALARDFQTSVTATARRCADLAGFTVFEVDHDRVTWAHGPLCRTIALVDDALQTEMRAACLGHARTVHVYLNDGVEVRSWIADYRPLGRTGRALFLLSLARSDTSVLCRP